MREKRAAMFGGQPKPKVQKQAETHFGGLFGISEQDSSSSEEDEELPEAEEDRSESEEVGAGSGSLLGATVPKTEEELLAEKKKAKTREMREKRAALLEARMKKQSQDAPAMPKPE